MLLLLLLVAGGEGLAGRLGRPSAKKGLCIPPGENFHCGDLEAFPRATWWYNWHTRSNHEMDGERNKTFCTCSKGGGCGDEPDSPAFIPMIWGYHFDGEWHDDIDDPVADRYPVILGFNEPNRPIRLEGADLSPEEAAEAWIEIQELYPDRVLVSPAPAGGNTHWFDAFFEACEVLGCRIDYLATHDYANYPTNQADRLVENLQMLYNRYGRKIWLTEFALCCTTDLAEVEAFLRAIIPQLEAADFVHRYSWFITRYNDKTFEGEWFLDKVNALFLEDSDELSPVGKLYNQL